MTHPSNKRRDKNEKLVRDAMKREGLPPPGEGESARKSPRGKRLKELRKRKARGD